MMVVVEKKDWSREKECADEVLIAAAVYDHCRNAGPILALRHPFLPWTVRHGAIFLPTVTFRQTMSISSESVKNRGADSAQLIWHRR